MEFVLLLKQNISVSRKPSDVLFVAGSLLDLNSLALLKNLATNLNVKFIKEINSPTNNLLSLSRSNVSIKSIEDSDLLLTIGTNPRFEASMYDMKIKKRSRSGLFIRASIGVHNNYTYENFSLGTTLKTLLEIIEGTHPFCKKLVNARKPIIVFNSSIYKSVDIKTLQQLLKLMNNNCRILSDEWFGVDLLSQTPNYSDFNSSYFNSVSLKETKLAYLVGVNDNKRIKALLNDQTIIIQQAAISDDETKCADLILPNNLAVENDATFLNLENRIQKTTKVNEGPGLAQSDFDIITTLQKLLKLYKPSDSYPYTDVQTNKLSFEKKLIKNQNEKLNKLTFSYFKSQINNFFDTDLITKNSLVLNKCAKNFKASYINFLK